MINFQDKKKKKIFLIVITLLLVFSMVAPVVIGALSVF